MKKITLSISLLILVAALSACGPAYQGKKVAEKFCECSQKKDQNEWNECNKKAMEEYQNLHRKYYSDEEDLKAFEEAFESHRTCNEQ